MPPYYIGVSGLQLLVLQLSKIYFNIELMLKAAELVSWLLFSPQSLRKALRIMGAPNLLADNMEYGLSYSVVSYLKKLSQQVRSQDVVSRYLWAHKVSLCLLSCFTF